jgi:hypothetical protein
LSLPSCWRRSSAGSTSGSRRLWPTYLIEDDPADLLLAFFDAPNNEPIV